MTKLVQKTKRFYGWWIVVASTLAMGLHGAVYFYGFSTFFMPLIREFDCTRAALSAAFSFSRIEGGFLGPLEGWLVDRFGPRKMMLIGVLIMGAGYVLLSRVNSLAMFYLIFIGAVATGTTLGLLTPAYVTITNWFIRKRSRAMGIVFSGMGIGGIVVPGLAWLITDYGWRSAAMTVGIVVWAICIPLAFVMRHRPEQYGYLPDGETVKTPDPQAQSPETSSFASEKETDAKEVDFTWRQAVKMPSFWLLGSFLASAG